jgi:hypothetical protein
MEAVMSLPKRSKRSPAEGELPFDYDWQPSEEVLTAYAGVPLFVRAARSFGVPESVSRNLSFKQRQRGFDEATYVESFLVLNALGGDCLEDFDRLREDAGLAEMLGHEMPSPEAARKFLYQFHDESRIEAAQRELAVGQVSYIPSESEPLRGLAQVNQDVVQAVGRRCAEQKIATIDVDATVIESWKREAKPVYQGGTGYQPVLALWAEMDLAVADEFRDGNVGAQMALLGVTKRAFAALPETVEQRCFRGDSACYEQTLMKWLRNRQREGGPEGFIGFAISARMSESLRDKIRMLPEAGWRAYGEDAQVTCEYAELPWDPMERKVDEVLDQVRYLVIRVRQRQGGLFEDGTLSRHFAVVTNRFDFDGKRLLEWHREKAGSIEALHQTLKNELSAGVMPCSRFGANAAWLRLAVITHNVLTGLKRVALKPDYLRARPKRLRFQIFCSPGKLIHHARAVVAKVRRRAAELAEWAEAWALLPSPA